MTSLTKDELDFFDPIMEFVYYYGSQKEYLTKKKDSKGWLKTVNKFTDFINDYIQRPSHPETLLQIKPLRAHFRKRMEEKKPKPAPRNWYFVTISPPEHIKIKNIKKMIKKMGSWTCWNQFIGVIEQRGITKTDIHGAHIHFLAEKTHKYAQSNVKQRLAPFKCKYNTNVQIVDETIAPDKQEYFFSKYGKTKKGEIKSEIMKIDVLFRKNNDIPRFYGEKIIF